MSNKDIDHAGDLQRLYRASACERTTAATDNAVLKVAREHARRKRRYGHFLGIAAVAAAVLVAILGQSWQRRQTESDAVRAHYAAITLPYLLDSRAGEDALARASRYLRERRESEQPAHPIDTPLDPAKGIPL